MPQRDIFNPSTQAVEPADLVVDANNEIVATFANGHFLKFPAGLDETQFSDQIAVVETANSDQIIITPEMEAANEAARAASEALIGVSAPEGDQTNDAPDPSPPTI